jgi:hypothetical protein
MDGFQLAAHQDHQAFAGELVENVENAELASIVGAIFNEVI